MTLKKRMNLLIQLVKKFSALVTFESKTTREKNLYIQFKKKDKLFFF